MLYQHHTSNGQVCAKGSFSAYKRVLVSDLFFAVSSLIKKHAQIMDGSSCRNWCIVHKEQ